MRYVSTRGGIAPQPFTRILLEGLAPDGGLTVPETYPRFDAADLARMRALPYPTLALEILSRFIGDIDRDTLAGIVAGTYTRSTFGDDAITPLKTLDADFHILGLSHGPTLSFKDIALQLLGNLFEHVLARDAKSLNILGATSGDTGSSAEHAMHGKRGIRVFMLSPHGKMSPFQAAQMYSLADANIHNVAIRGVFDECQDIVKSIGADAPFKARHSIGTVNSINFARVAAQVVYYFKGYFAATRDDEQTVSFSVPSGNFGNVLAGHVARSMGLPIERLIVATNENDVLDEFFRSGRYRVRTSAETHATSSPSMDISKASNFERFVFDLVDRQPHIVDELWQRIERDGHFDLAGTEYMRALPRYGFASGKSTHADRVRTIRDVEREYGVVIDPHTADGVKVGLEHRQRGEPLICLETALPVKFSAMIREALGREPERPAAFDGLESLPQRFDVLDPDVALVRRYIVQRATA